MRKNFAGKWRYMVVFTVLAVGITFAASICAADEVRLVGSGATFPFPLYTTWFKDFSKVDPNIVVDYQGKGSGAGIKDFIAGTVDFAASDAAMTDEEMAQVKQGVQLLPMTAGSIVLAYNLPGNPKGLKLGRDVYPKIFLGEIKNWNDPQIAKDNPGVKLPNLAITVVRRADASGTNFVFTKHLSAISDEWAKGPGFGTTVKWPESDKIIAAPKNDGVTATVKQTPGAIGYIEYGYAVMSKVEMAELQNKDGKFVMPNDKSGADALSKAVLPPDMRVWLSDPTGAGSYPIATYTWMLFYKKYDDAKKVKAIHELIHYCLMEGQKISGKLGYIPLPQNVVQEVSKAAENIK